jgi:hypothetical protein
MKSKVSSAIERRCLPFLTAGQVEGNCRADKVLQSCFVYAVVLVDVNCSPLIALKAGIEKLVMIW